MREVDANLVGPAGFKTCFHKCRLIVPFNDPITVLWHPARLGRPFVLLDGGGPVQSDIEAFLSSVLHVHPLQHDTSV